jgi:hypothetical protein
VKPGVRALERAFQIARAGVVQNVAEIKMTMDREGYDSRQIEGPRLCQQLRDLIRKARGTVEPEPKGDDEHDPE